MMFFTKLSVLICSDVLVLYAMWMMMIYLTDVWKLNLTHAAAIMNVFTGSIAILPLIIQFISDTLIGNYWIVLISTFSSATGMGLLTMSTPPVLAKSLGTCSAYEPECIGDEQRVLFYVAMALVAFGMAGHVTSLGNFAAQQMTLDTMEDAMENTNWCCSFVTMFLVSYFTIIVTTAAVVALPYIKPWSIRFGLPSIFALAATLFFLSGSCTYNYVRPQGSPITACFRVFVASASKLFRRLPRDPKKLHELQNSELHMVPHTRTLRFLDKAAILLPNQTPEQQRNNRWRLCRVTEVEETKIIIRMIPMWIPFIMCGVVSAIGFTYFVEQAKNMNRKVGRLTVPLPIFLWFYDQGKQQFASLYFLMASCLGGSGARHYAPPIGILVSMIFGILCCITAAKVEERRLDVVTTHGLLDKPDEKVPMSVFWLLPQFVLLGGLDGIFENSSALFFADQAPPSMAQYVVLFASAVYGLGCMGSVLCVYIVGEVSGRGGPNMSWFQDTLNHSRIDKYYWTLAWLSAANMGLFILMAILYTYRTSNLEDDEEGEGEGEESTEPFEDNAQCCC